MARVLITREFAEPLATCLSGLGHTPVHIPLVRLEPTDQPPPDGRPDAVLLTSKAAVRFVPELALVIGQSKVFVVGEGTASALRDCGVKTDYVGDAGGIDALQALQAVVTEGVVWYIGAEKPSAMLRRALTDASVVSWAVYRNERPEGYATELARCRAEVVTFTSGSAVRAYTDVLGPPQCAVVVLGDTTAGEARKAGVERIEVARAHTMDALAMAVSRVV